MRTRQSRRVFKRQSQQQRSQQNNSTREETYMTKPHRDANALLQEFFTNTDNAATALNLSNCNLETLPPVFETLIKDNAEASARMTLLNLAHNPLSTLPTYLNQLTSLRILFLLANNFTEIPAVLCEMQALRMLSFKENKLSGMLEARQLPPALTWLILTSNQLTGLSDDFSHHCRHVRKLMLSNNMLSDVPALHDAMHELELLRLANNRLRMVPHGLFKLRKLTWLALSGNEATGGHADIGDLPDAMRIEHLDDAFDIDWTTPMGRGASGAAYAATHKQSGTAAVVKQMGNTQGSDGRALDEISLSLAASGTPHVIHTLGFVAADTGNGNSDGDGDGDGDGVMHLVTQRLLGNVHALAQPPSFDSCTRSVYDKSVCLTAVEKRDVVDAVEGAVRGLHERGICHGDVYAHNVFISRVDGRIMVTLGDLGAAWHVPLEIRGEIAVIESRAVNVFKEEVMNLPER